MSFVLLGVRFPPKPPSATRAGPTHVVVQIYRGTGHHLHGLLLLGQEFELFEIPRQVGPVFRVEGETDPLTETWRCQTSC